MLEKRCIDLVLDVGANRGQFGQALRQYGYQGRLLSFEPGVDAHNELLKVTAADDKWHVAERMALGDRNGQVMLYCFNRSDMNSIYPPAPILVDAFERIKAQEKMMVSMRRLDDFLMEIEERSSRMFLKIDTQGAELSILKGASGILSRINGIQAELPVKPIYIDMPPLDECLRHIRALGFDPVMTSPASFNSRLGAQIDLDMVFLRQH